MKSYFLSLIAVFFFISCQNLKKSVKIESPKRNIAGELKSGEHHRLEGQIRGLGNDLIIASKKGNLQPANEILDDQKELARKTYYTEDARRGWHISINWSLRYASTHGHADIVKLLLYRGYANPDYTGSDLLGNIYYEDGESTPFMLSVENRHINIVKIFLEYFESKNWFYKDELNKALNLAKQKGYINIAKMLKDAVDAIDAKSKSTGLKDKDAVAAKLKRTGSSRQPINRQ